MLQVAREEAGAVRGVPETQVRGHVTGYPGWRVRISSHWVVVAVGVRLRLARTAVMVAGVVSVLEAAVAALP
jgi:hypothetical protein